MTNCLRLVDLIGWQGCGTGGTLPINGQEQSPQPSGPAEIGGKQAKIPGFRGFFLLNPVQISLNFQRLNMGMAPGPPTVFDQKLMPCNSGPWKPAGVAVGNNNCIHDPR